MMTCIWEGLEALILLILLVPSCSLDFSFKMHKTRAPEF